MSQNEQRPASYGDVFASREYRAMFASDLTSLLGDQVAAVALAVLLYQRSGSALLAALGYATAYVPWVVGGPVLSALADRLPPRRVVVGADLARAALIGLAAVPGVPIPALGLLVLLAALLAPPFEAAISSMYPQVLTGDRYAVGMSVRDITHQSSQIAGFVGGGALVGLVGPHGALGLDAASFAASALLLRVGLIARPSAVEPPRHLLQDAAEGLRVVLGDRRLYGPLLLGMCGAAYVVVPEAIAVAYAHSLGYGARAVGLIMAGVASGSILGSLVIGRFVGPTRRRALMWPMAMAGTLPLIAVALRPGLQASLVLFVLAGTGSAYQVAANTAFARAAPAHARARAFGIALTGMYGAQGLAIVAAGAAAQVFGPVAVIAGAGVLGAVAMLLVRPTLATAPGRKRSAAPGPGPAPATPAPAPEGCPSTAP